MRSAYQFECQFKMQNTLKNEETTKNLNSLKNIEY